MVVLPKYYYLQGEYFKTRQIDKWFLNPSKQIAA